MRKKIIEEAEEYKVALYERRKVEMNMVQNRERKTYTNFHKDADKNYWKAVAEIISPPRGVPNIQKKRSKLHPHQFRQKPKNILLEINCEKYFSKYKFYI